MIGNELDNCGWMKMTFEEWFKNKYEYLIEIDSSNRIINDY